MTKIDLRRALRPAVRIATDDEADDFVLQDHMQAFLRGFARIVPYQRIHDGLHKAVKHSRVTLLDTSGDPARVMELSEADFEAFGFWLRDYIIERPPHLARRNRPESLERRRLLITLCRMAWPRETSTWGKTDDELGLTFTHLEPPDEFGWD